MCDNQCTCMIYSVSHNLSYNATRADEILYLQKNVVWNWYEQDISRNMYLVHAQLFFVLYCTISLIPSRITSLIPNDKKNKIHDDVIKWKHFPRYWPFVRGIHRWPVDSPHKCQWRGALMFSLICAWTNGWANNRDTGDLRRHRAHYDGSVMDMT